MYALSTSDMYQTFCSLITQTVMVLNIDINPKLDLKMGGSSTESDLLIRVKRGNCHRQNMRGEICNSPSFVWNNAATGNKSHCVGNYKAISI